MRWRAEGVTSSSWDDVIDRFAVINFKPLATRNFQSTRIKPEQLEDSRMEIRDIVSIAQGMITQFVRCPVDASALDSRSRHPDGERMGMMIPSILSTCT